MRAILAALNWAHLQGWIPNKPVVKLVGIAKLKHMRGRPLTQEEFEQMLAAVEGALTTKASAPKTRNGKPLKKRAEIQLRKSSREIVESWQQILSALWESGLRLDELMHVSWDIPGTIRPVWCSGQLPVLEIPADMQKNATEESIPLLPGFEALLLKTPENERTGWVFSPASLMPVKEGQTRDHRPHTSWVGKIISRIGKAAGIVVDPGNPKKDKPPKYASAHDLRRSCLNRLKNAGVPADVLQMVARHADYRTTLKFYADTEVQQKAAALRVYLGTLSE